MGCIVTYIGWLTILILSVTYFPSNQQIAFDAVESDDIDRLNAVVSLIDVHSTQVGDNKHDHLTLLNIAVVESSPKLVALLLENGSDPNHQGTYNQTAPLHRVIYLREKPGTIEIIKLLIAHGADPQLTHSGGATPIEYAGEKDPAIINALRWRPDQIAE